MRKELKGLLERRGEGEVIGIASTENADRDGDIIVQSGWDLENFKRNPVILAHHNYHNFPIGQATEIAVENGMLMFKVLFSKVTEEARQAYELIQEGVLRSFSVGYIPREFDPKDQNRTLKAELLEISVVAVPANAEAIVYAKSFVKNDLAVRLCKEWLIDDATRKEVERLERTKAVGAKKTKEVAPAEVKGAIQDKLDSPSEYEIKEENCHQLWKAMDAFMRIYWDETIPSSDFSPLCKELSKIISKLGTDSVIGKNDLKGLTGNDDDDDEEDEDALARKQARFKKFLAVITEKESTPGDSNVEKTGEEGGTVEEKRLNNIRLLQKATGAMQELLRDAKLASKKGGVNKI